MNNFQTLRCEASRTLIFINYKCVTFKSRCTFSTFNYNLDGGLLNIFAILMHHSRGLLLLNVIRVIKFIL